VGKTYPLVQRGRKRRKGPFKARQTTGVDFPGASNASDAIVGLNPETLMNTKP